jgi:hypothetical protein
MTKILQFPTPLFVTNESIAYDVCMKILIAAYELFSKYQLEDEDFFVQLYYREWVNDLSSYENKKNIITNLNIILSGDKEKDLIKVNKKKISPFIKLLKFRRVKILESLKGELLLKYKAKYVETYTGYYYHPDNNDLILAVKSVEGELVYRGNLLKCLNVSLLNGINMSNIGEFIEFEFEKRLIRAVGSCYLTLNSEGSEVEKIEILYKLPTLKQSSTEKSFNYKIGVLDLETFSYNTDGLQSVYAGG